VVGEVLFLCMNYANLMAQLSNAIIQKFRTESTHIWELQGNAADSVGFASPRRRRHDRRRRQERPTFHPHHHPDFPSLTANRGRFLASSGDRRRRPREEAARLHSCPRLPPRATTLCRPPPPPRSASPCSSISGPTTLASNQ
jgi:hypothetical protein